jgi:hypothetical protein
MNNLEMALLGGTVILLVSAGACAGGSAPLDSSGSGAHSTSTVGSGGGTGGMATVTSTGGGGGGPSNGEICGNGLDDNGNGLVDEGCPCTVGATEPCFPGEPQKAGVGACKRGQQTCEKGSGEVSSSQWGACIGAGAPSTEVCNGVDDNCDGQVDEGCVCLPGTTVSCYSGPSGTLGVGLCHGGNKTCLPDGSGYSDCAGEVTPVTEVCGNGVDDDCDGQVDQGCVQCSTQSVVWNIPSGTTGGPSCITAGGGTCTEVLTCNGSSCSPQACGAPHCGTLACNDGTYNHPQYCSVVASCSSGGVTATGFTW